MKFLSTICLTLVTISTAYANCPIKETIEFILPKDTNGIISAPLTTGNLTYNHIFKNKITLTCYNNADSDTGKALIQVGYDDNDKCSVEIQHVSGRPIDDINTNCQDSSLKIGSYGYAYPGNYWFNVEKKR